MERNREEIIKALECCVKEWDCAFCRFSKLECASIKRDALALIKELTEERKDFEIRALRAENEATKYKDRCETEKQAREQLSESYDHLEKTKDELLAERSRLTEENERLKAENARYEAENHAQFDKWLKLEEATKRHHSELFEEAKIAVKEDTVRKMQKRLNESIDNSINVFDFEISECNAVRQALRAVKNNLYQIAKEMLNEKGDTE